MKHIQFGILSFSDFSIGIYGFRIRDEGYYVRVGLFVFEIEMLF